jgi:hypothetical protein
LRALFCRNSTKNKGPDHLSAGKDNEKQKLDDRRGCRLRICRDPGGIRGLHRLFPRQKRQQELIDPDTGISLGGSMTALGEIEVTQIQEKFSIARAVSLSGTPERGDKVMATTLAAPLEFADAWNEPR